VTLIGFGGQGDFAAMTVNSFEDENLVMLLLVSDSLRTTDTVISGEVMWDDDTSGRVLGTFQGARRN